jgi:hypothetical protein
MYVVKLNGRGGLHLVVQPLLERTLRHEAVGGPAAFAEADGRPRELPLHRVGHAQVGRVVVLETLVQVARQGMRHLLRVVDRDGGRGHLFGVRASNM